RLRLLPAGDETGPVRLVLLHPLELGGILHGRIVSERHACDAVGKRNAALLEPVGRAHELEPVHRRPVRLDRHPRLPPAPAPAFPGLGRAPRAPQPMGPACECTSTIAGPILSMSATIASRDTACCLSKAISGRKLPTICSVAGSSGSPLPGHCVCRCACGQSL